MQLGFASLPQEDLAYVVHELQGSAASLEEARVLVTGATGFVGRWLVASLAEMRRANRARGLGIVVLVRNGDSARSRLGDDLWREVDVIEADINRPWALERPVTHVFHGATPSSLRSGSADARAVLTTSVVGTQNLIQAIGASGHAPRVLHLSSGAVYGLQPKTLERIPETWTGGPTPFSMTTPYAEGKRAAEALLEAATREGLIEAVQARLFAFMGPGLPTSEGFAIGNFAGSAAYGRPVRVAGDGQTVRSYLEARDLAAWLISLQLNAPSGKPYNVGSPDGSALHDWASLCARIGQVEIEVGARVVGERPIYVPDISNSRMTGSAILGRSSSDALRSWVTWLRLRGRS